MKFESSTLFIIGNGFDSDHGLPTSYSDFKNYLRENYKIAENTITPPIQGDTLGGDYAYDEDDIASFLL